MRSPILPPGSGSATLLAAAALPHHGADSLLARFDFPREDPMGVERGRRVIEAALRGAGLEPLRMPFPSHVGRAEVAGAALAAAGILVLFAAARRSRRALGLALVLLAASGLALGGALDPVLPSREESNLVAVVEPRAAAERELVLGAHLDSKTEPLDHVGRAWLWAGVALLGTLAVASRVAGAGTARPLAALAGAGLVLCGAEFGGGRALRERSHGAADDGAAAMLLVELAGEARRAPPERTRLRFAWWAAEERGAQGSAADARRPATPLPTFVVNLDCLGAGPELGYAAREWTGRTVARGHAGLIEALGRAAPVRLREFRYPVVTDAGPWLRAGLPAVTLLGLGPGGSPPRGLHRPADRLAALDASGLEAARRTLRALVAASDSIPGP